MVKKLLRAIVATTLVAAGPLSLTLRLELRPRKRYAALGCVVALSADVRILTGGFQGSYDALLGSRSQQVNSIGDSGFVFDFRRTRAGYYPASSQPPRR